MKAKNQRLTLALLALVAVVGAGAARAVGIEGPGGVLLRAARREARRAAARQGGAARRDGRGRIGQAWRRRGDGAFAVTDGQATTPVRSLGSSPTCSANDRRGRGGVPPDGSFTASNLLAKHDEKYMPPPMVKTAAGDARDQVARPMTAEAGLAALWLAAALAALQIVTAAIGLARGRSDVIAAVRPMAIVQDWSWRCRWRC